MRTAVVVGGGSWGTGFSRLLADRGLDVTLATHQPQDAAVIRESGRNPRFLTDVDLSDVDATTIGEAPVADADLVVVVLPSRAFRSVVQTLPGSSPILSPDEGPRSRDRRPALDARHRQAGRGHVRPEHGRGGRGRPARRDRDRERGRRVRTAAPGDDQLGRLPRLPERRPRRRRALRRREERDRARRRRLRRDRSRRQRQGRAHHAWACRDGAPRRGRRRAPGYVLRACGDGRPDRHLLAPIRPEPPRRRADRPRALARGGCRRDRSGRRGADDRARPLRPCATASASSSRSRRASAPSSRARRWSISPPP